MCTSTISPSSNPNISISSVSISRKRACCLKSERRTFTGFDRGAGGVGTRNFIGIITTVNCSATVSKAIATHFNRTGGLEGYDNVDGVVALTHGGGCAINTNAEGYLMLIRTLQGYARHPNFGGYSDDRARLRDQPDRSDP